MPVIDMLRSHAMLAGALALAFCVAPLRAEEDKKDALAAEAKEAAEEDAAEEKLDSESMKKLFEGKVVLYPEGQERENPEVLGVFVSEGKTYLLKVPDAEHLKDLKTLQNKQVTLNGKIRNKGKYFILVGIMHAGAAPQFTRRRGGI